MKCGVEIHYECTYKLYTELFFKSAITESFEGGGYLKLCVSDKFNKVTYISK